MECQEFRKHISDFANHRLKYKQTSDCLEHAKHCESCRDELEIYYIVEWGIKDNMAFEGHFVLQDIIRDCFAKSERIILRGKRRQLTMAFIRLVLYMLVFAGAIVLVTYFL